MSPAKVTVSVPQAFSVGAALSTEARRAVGEHGGGMGPALGEHGGTSRELLPWGSAGQEWVVQAGNSQTTLFIVLSRILRLPYKILRVSWPEMSLESLFQHIIFTEHQAEESRRVMREVRSEIARCRGKIKKATEDLNEEKIKLESKVQQFSEKTFLLELLKTRENALERQCSAIVSERDRLLQACEAIKKKTTEQEERFIEEITDFNDNYEITKKRDALMEEDIKLEMADLENQAEALRGEMKSMEYNSGQLQELQKLKSELLQELFTLQKKLKVLKDEETEAICITKHLEAEKIKIREKPQHDPECVRLKRELDLYKEEDMESVCRALQIEVDLLESTLVPKDPQDNNSLSR